MSLIELLCALIALPLVLHFGVTMPRRLVAEIHLDHRILRQEAKLPKALSIPTIFGITALWLLTTAWIIQQDVSPHWRLFTLGLAACLLLGAIIDARTGLLPFQVSAWVGLGGLLYQSQVAPLLIGQHIFTGICIYVVLTLTNRLVMWWSRQQMLGGGDVMLLSAVASFLSIEGIAWSLMLATLTGFVEGRLYKRSIIRFGPHLSLAILSYWLSRVMLT